MYLLQDRTEFIHRIASGLTIKEEDWRIVIEGFSCHQQVFLNFSKRPYSERLVLKEAAKGALIMSASNRHLQ
jgi:hypothetical protein